MTDLVTEAIAADGRAMTFAELRAFMDQAAAAVPSGGIRIRAWVNHRGDIEKAMALSPPPDDTGGTELPGDFARYLAAVLEADERGDGPADMTIFAAISAEQMWAMLRLLASESLQLAHAVFGEDAAHWIDRFRLAGNALDANQHDPE